MPIKDKEWPDQGELVIGTVSRVSPYSAFVKLEEYGNKEGMIHISEVSRKWVKDIKTIVKEGQKVVVLVIRLDKEKGHISLSLKKVNKRASEERLKQYKEEQKADKMLKAVAAEMKMDVEDVYKEIGFELTEKFDGLFNAFKTALLREEILEKKKIPKKWIKIIKKIAEKQMALKEKDLKRDIEITSYDEDGVEKIKKIIKAAEKKYKVKIKYISAPIYSINIQSKDPRSAEKTLTKVAEEIIKNIEKTKGEGKIIE